MSTLSASRGEPLLPSAAPESDVGRIDNAYRIVERHLANRAFLVDDAPTIADFSLGGYLFHPIDESAMDIPKTHPNLAAWTGRLRALPGWGDPYEVSPGARIGPKW